VWPGAPRCPGEGAERDGVYTERTALDHDDRFIIDDEDEATSDRPHLTMKRHRGVGGGLGRRGELAKRSAHPTGDEGVGDALSAGVQAV